MGKCCFVIENGEKDFSINNSKAIAFFYLLGYTNSSKTHIVSLIPEIFKVTGARWEFGKRE